MKEKRYGVILQIFEIGTSRIRHCRPLKQPVQWHTVFVVNKNTIISQQDLQRN